MFRKIPLMYVSVRTRNGFLTFKVSNNNQFSITPGFITLCSNRIEKMQKSNLNLIKKVLFCSAGLVNV